MEYWKESTLKSTHDITKSFIDVIEFEFINLLSIDLISSCVIWIHI